MENIYGDDFVARLRVFKKIEFPKSGTLEKSNVEKIIIDKGLWDSYSMLNTFSLSKDIQEGKIDTKIIKELKDFVKVGEVRKIYLSKSK